MGLDVDQVGSIGWSLTTVRPETLDRYGPTVAEIEASLVLWRRMEAGSGRGTSAGKNLLACTCPCGRRIRAARATLKQGGITCGLCHGEFDAPEAAEPAGEQEDAAGA